MNTTDDFFGHSKIYVKKRTLLFRYLLIINLIWGAWYLEWRINHSLNFDFLWFSILLLLAEIYSYFGGVLFLVGLWRPIERKIKSLNDLNPPMSDNDYPKVDVFITCYNEPKEIVESTARAALNLIYPATKLAVYILDDGNSPEIRHIAEQIALEDLQTDSLQQEAQKLNQKRYKLNDRLQQLKNLLPVIEAGSSYLEQFKLEVESKPDCLPQVLTWFDSCKVDYIPENVWVECQTLLGEIFDNVLCHSHRKLPAETPVEIDLRLYTHCIEIRVYDRGQHQFDIEEYLSNSPTVIGLDQERGRGISVIIRQLADYLSYTQSIDGGNCFLVFKQYKPLNTVAHHPSSLSTSYLQALEQFTILNTSKRASLKEILEEEIEKVDELLSQTEWQFSKLFRCHYIARPKPQGKPHHAKAGNINYAIFSGETSGDLILTLDADHIPKPHLLQRVVPYFFQYNLYSATYNFNDVAFVQTPQAFYNLPDDDPFGHQAHLFYGPIQKAKDGMNSAFYTGTNAVLKREALVQVGLQNFSDDFEHDTSKLEEIELIGALSSISITEDMNTAMRLHASGWKSVYHNEVLAEGLAPDDLSSTLKQRLRWAQGTIQVLLHDNPLKKSGLTFWQQLQYFQTMYSYFSGFFVLIFLLCPILYFFTGIIPVQAYGAGFAVHFIPTYLLNRLTFLSVGWGIPGRELWRSEQYAIGLFPLFIQAVLSVFTGRKLTFQVTPKQRQSGVYLGLILPQLTLFVLTLLGMLFCLYRWLTGSLDSPLIYLVNGGWATYNLALLWGIIRASVWKPENQAF